jgi:hypothetical protein
MASKQISGFACSATRSAVFTLVVEISFAELAHDRRSGCVRKPGPGQTSRWRLPTIRAAQVAGFDPFGVDHDEVPYAEVWPGIRSPASRLHLRR